MKNQVRRKFNVIGLSILLTVLLLFTFSRVEAENETWQLLTENAAWSARNQHTSLVLPNGSILMMGGVGNGGDTNDVWRSNDGGFSWELVIEDAPWAARRSATSVVLPNGNIVLIGGHTSIHGSFPPRRDVWRSVDNGLTWQLMTDSPEWPGRINTASVVNPNDGSILIIGGDNYDDVWRSEDQGATWSLVTDNPGWQRRTRHTVVLLPTGRILLLGGLGTGSSFLNDIWYSDNWGETWTELTDNAEWAGRWGHTSVVLKDGSILLMGGWIDNQPNGEVWQSEDGGETWEMLTDEPGWVTRYSHTSEVLPNGNVLLLGGWYQTHRNDVWRLPLSSMSFSIFLPLVLR